MTTTTASAAFINWLNNKLRELNTDESVFGAYIIGLLEGDETNEEKKDALEGILSEIIDKDLQTLITEILYKWQEHHLQIGTCGKSAAKDVDVNEQLTKLLEAQKLQTVAERQLTAEEHKIKQQILAQYSKTEISEDDYEDSGDENKTNEKATKSLTSGGGLERNTNAADVLQKQKERREQARLDSAAKKQKDKDDREKQKQQREEKKEKRKTVKGERRR